jgi:hypothetical protein
MGILIMKILVKKYHLVELELIRKTIYDYNFI